MNRIGVPDVPLEVYSFLNFCFHIVILVQSFERVKLLLKHLKRQCHEIFDLYFFHESNPSGPLINRLKWFCLKIRIREDIQIRSSKNSTLGSVILCGVEIF